MIQIDVGCSHIEVHLNKEGLSHVDISCLFHILSVHFFYVVITIGYKELFIFIL
jgi:hypothetical protein